MDKQVYYASLNYSGYRLDNDNDPIFYLIIHNNFILSMSLEPPSLHRPAQIFRYIELLVLKLEYETKTILMEI